MIEQEMNEQAKNVEVLKTLGASQTTIESEQKKFEELEAAVFYDFRQDIMKKIKRQSVKATAIKDKLGLGYKPVSNTHMRSKSTSQAAAFMGTPAQRKSKDLNKSLDPSRLAAMLEDEHNEPVVTTTSTGFVPSHHRALSFDNQLLRQKRHKSPSPRPSKSGNKEVEERYLRNDMSSDTDDEREQPLSKSLNLKKR